MQFRLQSDFKPSGDQPQAINTLVDGIEKEHKHQVLLGITGSGKTFSMANVVQQLHQCFYGPDLLQPKFQKLYVPYAAKKS